MQWSAVCTRMRYRFRHEHCSAILRRGVVCTRMRYYNTLKALRAETGVACVQICRECGEIGEPCSGALCASGCVTVMFSKHYVRKRMPSACGDDLIRPAAGSYLGRDCRRYPLCALLSAQNGCKYRQVLWLRLLQQASAGKVDEKKRKRKGRVKHPVFSCR